MKDEEWDETYWLTVLDCDICLANWLPSPAVVIVGGGGGGGGPLDLVSLSGDTVSGAGGGGGTLNRTGLLDVSVEVVPICSVLVFLVLFGAFGKQSPELS